MAGLPLCLSGHSTVFIGCFLFYVMGRRVATVLDARDCVEVSGQAPCLQGLCSLGLMSEQVQE